MDDYLFLLCLACAFLLGIVIAACRPIAGCEGSCQQGRQKCNCACGKN